MQYFNSKLNIMNFTKKISKFFHNLHINYGMSKQDLVRFFNFKNSKIYLFYIYSSVIFNIIRTNLFLIVFILINFPDSWKKYIFIIVEQINWLLSIYLTNDVYLSFLVISFFFLFNFFSHIIFCQQVIFEDMNFIVYQVSFSNKKKSIRLNNQYNLAYRIESTNRKFVSYQKFHLKERRFFRKFMSLYYNKVNSKIKLSNNKLTQITKNLDKNLLKK